MEIKDPKFKRGDIVDLQINSRDGVYTWESPALSIVSSRVYSEGEWTYNCSDLTRSGYLHIASEGRLRKVGESC